MSKPKFLSAAHNSAHGAFEKANMEARKSLSRNPLLALKKADRSFQEKSATEGLTHIGYALANADNSEHPDKVTSKAVQLCLKHGHFEQARVALDAARQKFPENLFFLNQYGNFHLLTENPKAAIQLLAPFAYKFKEDPYFVTTLATAYLQDNQPRATIRTLKEFHRNNPSNSAAAKILASAYTKTHQRGEFLEVVSRLEDPRARDYLTAKFCYLHNESQKALAILRPYATGEKQPSHNMRFLFFACTGGIPLSPREQEEFDKWQKNSDHDLLRNDFMASSVTMFKEGANPVSKDAKQAANLGRDARVHVRQPVLK